MWPDLNIDDENDEPDEKWVPNLKFDSNKVKWNDESGSEDDIESDNEEDFLRRCWNTNGEWLSMNRLMTNCNALYQRSELVNEN